MARPTALTPEVSAVIVRAVHLGMPWRLASGLANVSERTVYGWLKRGKAGEEPYLQFLQDVKRAEKLAIEHALQVIRKAADAGDWKPAAWLLERRAFESFGHERRRLRELEARLKEIEERHNRGY